MNELILLYSSRVSRLAVVGAEVGIATARDMCHVLDVMCCTAGRGPDLLLSQTTRRRESPSCRMRSAGCLLLLLPSFAFGFER